MKTHWLLLALLLSPAMPCRAAKTMAFNGVDKYVDGAKGIWIVEAGNLICLEAEDGFKYKAKIIQTLKGDSKKQLIEVYPHFVKFTPGNRYVVFGFNPMSNGAWLDNGGISPIPLPDSFSLSELKGKTLKEQIFLILSARQAEIKRLIKQLNDEETAIQRGLDFQKRSDEMSPNNKTSTNRQKEP